MSAKESAGSSILLALNEVIKMEFVLVQFLGVSMFVFVAMVLGQIMKGEL